MAIKSRPIRNSPAPPGVPPGPSSFLRPPKLAPVSLMHPHAIRSTMKYRTLGGSGARVSEICLGAMTFGEADANSMMHKASISEEAAHAIMSRALELGVNFWDTANVYGQDGLSERVIGSWFARNGHRDDVMLATKCRLAMGPAPTARRDRRLH